MNHLSHNVSSFDPSSDDVGRFLNSLNIKLIMADKEEMAEGKFLLSLKQVGQENYIISFSMCNSLIFNVNYDKGLRGQGKKCSQ